MAIEKRLVERHVIEEVPVAVCDVCGKTAEPGFNYATALKDGPPSDWWTAGEIGDYHARVTACSRSCLLDALHGVTKASA